MPFCCQTILCILDILTIVKKGSNQESSGGRVNQAQEPRQNSVWVVRVQMKHAYFIEDLIGKNG